MYPYNNVLRITFANPFFSQLIIDANCVADNLDFSFGCNVISPQSYFNQRGNYQACFYGGEIRNPIREGKKYFEIPLNIAFKLMSFYQCHYHMAYSIFILSGRDSKRRWSCWSPAVNWLSRTRSTGVARYHIWYNSNNKGKTI